MWLPKSGSTVHGGDRMRKGTSTSVVAVAIDKDKYSQHALKWSIEHLLSRGQTVVLIHVIRKPPTTGNYPSISILVLDDILIQCYDVILEDTNIAKALTEYASYAAIEFLILGASSKHGFIRFRTSDVPSHVMKSIPDFCTVYVISKAKISSAKKSSRAPPFPSPLREKIQEQTNNNFEASVRRKNSFNLRKPEKAFEKPVPVPEDPEAIRSPFNRGRGLNVKLLCGELLDAEADLSFISSERPSCDWMSDAGAMYYDMSNVDLTPRMSGASDRSFQSPFLVTIEDDMGSMFSSTSMDSRVSTSTRASHIFAKKILFSIVTNYLQHDDVDNEMRKLKMELQRTMEMYSSACKDALTAQQKAGELERWRVEEAQKVSEAKIGDEQSREVAETEKERYQALMAKARASRRIADSEKQALEHPEEEKHQDSSDKQQREFRYRRYTIDEIEKATEFFTEARKIGEGGYGPVFKGRLDNTPVAIKVLRPDAAQGKSQFQQEVEVLSCMRHPNMVLLLGACPEYGCLVYEYMSIGSLEDRLLRRGNTPPLPWQIRFKIAAEIISDVGLARLLPASSLTEDVSQYRMTSAAGTMCYIDPEYQQTGMLGVKSDVYSLGIMLLQLVTAKPAMGLAHHVRRAINKGNFDEMLDPTVHDWPVEEAFGFAKLSIQCAELKRKDIPDLGKVVLPELNRLREFGEE
ncbi:U-box domain-containing protein 35-like protein [Tanacetum coccineum]